MPITGVSLLLRALILGEYHLAWRFFLPVLVPTIVYGAVALRWAIDQFQREDVLFREAERFDLRCWVRHLLRDKEPTPNGGEALFCFALMLTLEWFLMQYSGDGGPGVVAGGPGCRAGGGDPDAPAGDGPAADLEPPADPPALLAQARATWAWPSRCRWRSTAWSGELRPIVDRLFPLSQALKEAFETMMVGIPNIYVAVLLLALVPAICEEFAFRGFILTGMEYGHQRRTAILLSALLFGFLHVLLSLFQQLFNATLLGIILGMLAVRSGSILPGIVFHFLNNGLAVVQGAWLADPSSRRIATWLYRNPAEGLYHWLLIVLSALVSGALLVLLRKSGPSEPPPERVAGASAEPLVAMSDAR